MRRSQSGPDPRRGGADPNKPKLFCIGFHKTGTSSLREALKILGYSVTGPNHHTDPDIARKVIPLAHELVAQFDAFQDNPWPIIYREMDAAYPGSKFILTRRDPQAWIRSQVKHFGTRETPMRRWIYGEDSGCPVGNEEVYLARYRRHYGEVEEYFRDRPGDIVEMELAAGDGWEKLCAFLGAEVPNVPFPHANKASARARRRARQAVVGAIKKYLRLRSP